MATRLTRALLALATLLVATAAEAALPPAPFALSASPVALVEGAPLVVSIAPVRGEAAGERFDLYVVLASVAQAAFLTPQGAWVAQPTPYAQGRTTADGPLTRQWPKAWPSGRHALGLVVVPAGAEPLARADWRFRPSIAWIDVAPAAPGSTPADRGTLALLVLSLAVAIALVWWAGRDGDRRERGGDRRGPDPPRRPQRQGARDGAR
jgi:hypothetical protein